MVLHALKEDQTIARRDDAVVLAVEVFAEAKRLDLVFQEKLDRFLQAALDFADTDKAKARFRKASDNAQFTEVMRLARSSATMRALIAARLPKWGENCGGLNS